MVEKNTKKIELLAPAGSYEGFLAALAGGADAIYLAGSEFGARAYAKNLDNEQLLQAIDMAHFCSRKLYLTVNTLVKDKEFASLYDFIKPLYQRGLDGVIVQDLGVVAMFRRYFPALPIHASTQMCVTSGAGAMLLKELGINRVVPARELSLSELKAMKDETGLEIECFIHGSMCYSYSGQCLMSSFLGGRSGNRGRCAGPCRQPYSVCDENKNATTDECYPISMKDLCTIQYIPELIEAGIDSFKIEGRMKDPQYTYLITSIYRKYIDYYLENGRKGYKIYKEDYDALTGSYLRDDVQNGYLFKHNGKELISLSKGGYNGDRKEIDIPNVNKTPLIGKCLLTKDQPAKLSVSVPWKDKTITISATGAVCQEPISAPVSVDDVKKQLSKTGDTPFEFTSLAVEMPEPVFIGIKDIKDLRRKAIEKIENMLASGYIRRMSDKDSYIDKTSEKRQANDDFKISVLVETKEQLEAVVNEQQLIDDLYIEAEMVLNDSFRLPRLSENINVYIALPYVLRINSRRSLLNGLSEATLALVDGFLVRNVDELYFAKENFPDKQIITDFNLYAFNGYAGDFYKEMGAIRSTRPLELSYHELGLDSQVNELVIYGHMPMMISAGCVVKTTENCIGEGRHKRYLQDRMGVLFPVIENCEYCYNRILNSVPTSLHADVNYIKELSPKYLRLQFSIESKDDTEKIIEFYYNLLKGDRTELPFRDFTRGHFKKSAI